MPFGDPRGDSPAFGEVAILLMCKTEFSESSNASREGK